MNLNFTVQKENENISVKEFLRQHDVSLRLLFKLRKNNFIFCNNTPCQINNIVHVGDIISINLDYPEDNSNIVPADIPIDIIYEDPHYLVINKQPNIAVHPSILHYNNSLSNGIRFYFDKIGLKRKIRIVNRLDRDTSRVSYMC